MENNFLIIVAEFIGAEEESVLRENEEREHPPTFL